MDIGLDVGAKYFEQPSDEIVLTCGAEERLIGMWMCKEEKWAPGVFCAHL